MSDITSGTAEYKGRKYRLAWLGETKYGRRAKLQFFDGSKEFWVPADAVSVLDDGPQAAARRAGVRGGMRRCPECGGWRHHSDFMCGEPCD
jgi:hypothetical protein